MTPRFAEGTEVPVERSRAEIERILRRYGADQFVSGWNPTAAVVGFSLSGRQIRFQLPMPDPNSKDITHTNHANPRKRTQRQREDALEQASRQRWRALALCIKAKLEAVESGITTFDEEFLAHTVLPDGRTAGDFLVPQIARAYETAVMPPMLPMLLEGPDG